MANQCQKACDADLKKLKFPVWGLPKIDGVRQINLTGQAVGRSLDPLKNVYTATLYSQPQYKGIDGELVAGLITSDSLCRDTTSAVMTIKGEPVTQWWAFDYLTEHTADMTYAERYRALLIHISVARPAGVNPVPYVILNSVEEVETFYNACLDKGYEGLILRDPNGKHKDGRSTTKEGAYLRLKPQSDKEAKVLRLVEAMENTNVATEDNLGHTKRSTSAEGLVPKGMVGMLVCLDLTTKQEINVGPGKMTHEERVHFWNHPEEIVDGFIKYRSMDSGVKDKPRFARYISRRAVEDMEKNHG